ncbi:hypothetical protein CAC42_7070 [Sphaceloma murrayae]|uniref:Multiple RNA-binding domain-containing protein 1 n=1 Tax=Sphaceloma murrayae TaxID=2082308 RepID=A0A2K1QQL7_9PEZI|nr:hypothetical protein CAC42_7070 [Sphaceloma murrayae]
MTSRIFVTGLPPSLSATEFKRHFSSQGVITDSKLFPERRIGYVGYTTSQEAERAVKYFNKTFIRMSKLAVEIARPIASMSEERQGRVPAAPIQTLMQPTSGTLKRKRGSNEAMEDPKLKEYLEIMHKKPNTMPKQMDAAAEPIEHVVQAEELSDDDVQTISRKKRSHEAENGETGEARQVAKEQEPTDRDSAPLSNEATTMNALNPSATDEDWLRSRTSRLLDLSGQDDEMTTSAPAGTIMPGSEVSKAPGHDAQHAPEKSDMIDADITENSAEAAAESDGQGDEAERKIRESSRLYLRNLAYSTTEDNIRESFSQYGDLLEVHVAMDKKTGQSKGFAFILFDDANNAVTARRRLDGTPLNGRLLHILPGTSKRETKIDDFALSKLPHKKQEQIKRKQEAATKTFNWNSLYMNQDAVLSSVADRLGVDKSTILDPTSSDAAVKQAHAETHVIQETKTYFRSQGVNLDSFSTKKRGDTAILVKNFPYDAKAGELKALFEQHGSIKRFLLPPSGTIAIIEFDNSAQAKAAFKSLAYSRIKSSMLYLEFAPKDLFDGEPMDEELPPPKKDQPNAADLLQAADVPDTLPTATLFVRNLNFSTTTQQLNEVFRPLDGFLSALVKTKTDPKKPGQLLSMGFGFLEFRSKTQAQKALFAMDGYKLDGHSLSIRASHKGQDAAEERKQSDRAKKQAAKRAKLVVKNLPFEATKKDIRSLLGAYGQLRSVRVPKKVGQSTRGFAFAEFTSPKEAENALDALQNTHLLGRRLVIDYAAEDPEDAEEEIEKMQNKVGSQLNKVAVQKLMGDNSRSKFRVNDQGVDE